MEQDFEDQKGHAVDEIKFINKYELLMKRTLTSTSTTTTSVNYESDDESRLSDVIGGKSSVNSNLSEIKAAAVAGNHQGELEQQTTEEEEDGQQEEQQNESLYTEKEEISTQALIAEDEDEDEEEGSGSCLMKQQEEEIDTAAAAANDEDYLISSSTDELNKKFEDFIRKMKEEIRIEAQRQPIAV